MKRRLWIYRRLIRCWLRTPAAWIQERRELSAKLEGLTDPGYLDRIQ